MIDLSKLKIYNLAKEVGREAYNIANGLPNEEYKLKSQLKSAAISIGANIAEGAGRSTKADFRRFLFISLGSLNETKHYAELIQDTNMLSSEEIITLQEKLVELSKMITSFVKSVSINKY